MLHQVDLLFHYIRCILHSPIYNKLFAHYKIRFICVYIHISEIREEKLHITTTVDSS